MIVKGLILGALVGAIAYNSAKRDGARETLLSAASWLVLLVFLAVAIRFDLDLNAVWVRLSGSTATLLQFLVGFIGLAVVAGWFARWTSRLNLSPPRIGLIFFCFTFVSLNMLDLYFRFKEQT